VSSAAQKRARLIRSRITDLEQRLVRERLRLEDVEDELSGPLRGADVATQALRRARCADAHERLQRDGWLHYADWFELVQGWEGVVIAGDDPLATFLTAIYRDPRVEGKGERSGLYRPKEETR
jgi:hypothetical protein